MITGLVEAGCHYIQIDAPGYTAYVDPPSLERMRARGEDPEANLARSISADNAVIAGFQGVTFGIHVCRGNPRTVDPLTGRIVPQWHREGAYDGSPNVSLPVSNMTACCWSTTANGQAASSRYALCPETRW